MGSLLNINKHKYQSPKFLRDAQKLRDVDQFITGAISNQVHCIQFVMVSFDGRPETMV